VGSVRGVKETGVVCRRKKKRNGKSCWALSLKQAACGTKPRFSGVSSVSDCYPGKKFWKLLKINLTRFQTAIKIRPVLTDEGL
ncbi:hypothetical protein, partial [Pseudomonas lactis]|uniref:hypothetical protein n=1 Tax=Pseudomonas lactis TaxID=1615674 RepID=UPI001F45028C